MWRAAVGVGLMAVGVAACKQLEAPPPAPFEVAIHVESDPGRPVPGVTVLKAGKEGPQTDANGRVVLKISGVEGESVDLTIRCPPDYTSPSAPITVLLHRLSGGKAPEYQATCTPSLRRMVVAVRADNGGNLPVTYLGKAIAKTDAKGAATLLFQLHPGESFELALDTTQPGFERIQPKTPSALFVMKPYDDVVTLDQKFTWAPKPRVYHAPPPRPVKIRSHESPFAAP